MTYAAYVAHMKYAESTAPCQHGNTTPRTNQLRKHYYGKTLWSNVDAGAPPHMVSPSSISGLCLACIFVAICQCSVHSTGCFCVVLLPPEKGFSCMTHTLTPCSRTMCAGRHWDHRLQWSIDSCWNNAMLCVRNLGIALLWIERRSANAIFTHKFNDAYCCEWEKKRKCNVHTHTFSVVNIERRSADAIFQDPSCTCELREEAQM